MATQLTESEIPAASRPLVVFSLDDQRYALPVARVQRSIRVVATTPLPEAPPVVIGVIDLGGVVIPVIDVRKRFDHPAREVHLSDNLVVASTGKRTVALLVDETNGVIEVSSDDITPADECLPGLGLIDGAVRLADGLVLIHDLGRLLSLDEETAIDRALNASGGETFPNDRRDRDEDEGASTP